MNRSGGARKFAQTRYLYVQRFAYWMSFGIACLKNEICEWT